MRRLSRWLAARFGRTAPGPDPTRTPRTEVGWLVDLAEARFVFDAPRPLRRKRGPPEHAKAVDRCPAILDHESRLFEVPCPFDLQLRLDNRNPERPRLVNAQGPRSAVAAQKLNRLVQLMPRERWREGNFPVLQIAAPWRFVADDPVWMTQTGAYDHYRDPSIPGVVIGGRFPIHLWPRIMMWAFEWRDPSRDLVLRRGEPWFYVHFETRTPEQPIRLVEAEMTPALREYCQGIDGVTSYVKGTFGLMATAARRRPERLLQEKRTDAGESDPGTPG